MSKVPSGKRTSKAGARGVAPTDARAWRRERFGFDVDELLGLAKHGADELDEETLRAAKIVLSRVLGAYRGDPSARAREAEALRRMARVGLGTSMEKVIEDRLTEQVVFMCQRMIETADQLTWAVPAALHSLASCDDRFSRLDDVDEVIALVERARKQRWQGRRLARELFELATGEPVKAEAIEQRLRRVRVASKA